MMASFARRPHGASALFGGDEAARPRVFFWRVVGHATAAAAIVAMSLGVGMWGYMHYEHLAWRDAFVNAAMLLAGLILLVAVGIIMAPVVHRLLHKFHLEQDDGGVA